MAGLGDLFGRGSIAEQMFVWGILNNVIQAAGNPYFTQLTYELNELHPVVELTPAELALMVIRNVTDEQTAAAAAQRSGLTAGKFADLVHITGDAMSPTDLAVALRRKLIPEEGSGPASLSFAQGIREGRLQDKWIPVIKDLATEWPTPTDILEALLQGQLTHPDALAKYQQTGGDPQWFDLLFHTRGEGPSPLEAGTLANRGIIPWDGEGPDATTYQQAFLESRYRNKWLAPMRELSRYLPPPRTVTAMLRAGSLTRDEALTLFEHEGLDPNLAAAYVADATRQKTQAGKELTESQIVALYEDHIVTEAEAQGLLVKLGMPAHDAELLLAGATVRDQITQVRAAVNKVRASFLARKIDAAAVTKDLGALGVSGPAAASLLRVWATELAATPKRLTDAQIGQAAKYSLISPDEAMSLYVADGYDRHDAWVVLGIHLGGKPQGIPEPA